MASRVQTAPAMLAPPTVHPDDLLARQVSLFQSCKAKKPSETLTLGEFFAAAKAGRWRKLIVKVREANKDSAADANKVKVALLPVLKPSGTFAGLAAKDLLVHSGILCIDFDELGAALGALREKLMADAYVIAVFCSPRGTGLKVFVCVTAKDAATHKLCFEAAYRHFAPMTPAGAKLDTAPCNVASNCFASYDPEIWVATTPRQVFVPAPELPTVPREKGEKKVISEVSGVSGLSEVSISHLALAPRQRRAAAEKRLASLPSLLGGKDGQGGLFDKYLAHRPVRRGQRHAFLVKIIPAIYQLFSAPVVLDLLLLHYDLQEGIWAATRAEHEAEIRAMLAAWPANYVASLPTDERQIYATLEDENNRAAFRICRDLAKKEGVFFLSCAGLGDRIGKHCVQAQRILRGFNADGVVDIIEVGGIWKKGGGIPKATTWKWLLGSHQSPSPDSPSVAD